MSKLFTLVKVSPPCNWKVPLFTTAAADEKVKFFPFKLKVLPLLMVRVVILIAEVDVTVVVTVLPPMTTAPRSCKAAVLSAKFPVPSRVRAEEFEDFVNVVPLAKVNVPATFMVLAP